MRETIIVPIEVKIAYDKIRHPVMLKTLRKLEIEGNFLNLI